MWHWFAQSTVIMLELGTFSANLHDVSDYHYNEKLFALVSMLMEVPGGH